MSHAGAVQHRWPDYRDAGRSGGAGLQAYDQLRAAGFSEVEALQQQKTWLQAIQDAHTQLGVPIDENTQKLLDQARGAGRPEGRVPKYERHPAGGHWRADRGGGRQAAGGFPEVP